MASSDLSIRTAETLMQRLGSRKFVYVAIALIAMIGIYQSGKDAFKDDPERLIEIYKYAFGSLAFTVGLYCIGQGIADFGKSRQPDVVVNQPPVVQPPVVDSTA